MEQDIPAQPDLRDENEPKHRPLAEAFMERQESLKSCLDCVSAKEKSASPSLIEDLLRPLQTRLRESLLIVILLQVPTHYQSMQAQILGFKGPWPISFKVWIFIPDLF